MVLVDSYCNKNLPKSRRQTVCSVHFDINLLTILKFSELNMSSESLGSVHSGTFYSTVPEHSSVVSSAQKNSEIET